MSTKKLLWANDLRAVAVTAVITLHVASTISLEYPNISKSYFLTSLGIDCLVRWCVPVFLMLSGSFALENYNGNMKPFFSKMFYRIVLPFLFWSIVYLFVFSWKDMAAAKNTHDLLVLIGHLFWTGTASHLWYVYMIVSLYLTFPILSRWVKEAPEKEYLLFLVVWIILIVLDPVLSKMEANNFELTFFAGYLGYIVLGNYLAKTPRIINRMVLVLLFMATLAYMVIRSYILSVREGQINEQFLDNLSVNVIIMSFCIFLFFKQSAVFSGSRARKLVNLVAAHSYGIYLAHLLFLNIFLWLGWNFHFVHPLLSIPIITGVCLAVSTGCILLMKKIPVLNRLAG